MNFPVGLKPTTKESIAIADGHTVEVQKARPIFAKWEGPSPGSSYGHKAILDYDGRPAFAELAILWTFMDAGWNGAWLDTFGGRALQAFWPSPQVVDVPEHRKELIHTLAKSCRAQPWDVFCWKESFVAFVEAKRSQRDTIRDSQRAFLRNALASNVQLSSFLVVEWRLTD